VSLRQPSIDARNFTYFGFTARLSDTPISVTVHRFAMAVSFIVSTGARFLFLEVFDGFRFNSCRSA